MIVYWLPRSSCAISQVGWGQSQTVGHVERVGDEVGSHVPGELPANDVALAGVLHEH